MSTSTATAPVLDAGVGLGIDQPSSHPGMSAAGVSEDGRVGSSALYRALSEIKGQSQFLLYLADQIEESMGQLGQEADACQSTFLCKVVQMYAAQLEVKHQMMGDRIHESVQELYLAMRDFETS